MEEIRLAVAKALGVKPEDLGCFTVMDHESQPGVIVVHGEACAGVYVDGIEHPVRGEKFCGFAKLC